MPSTDTLRLERFAEDIELVASFGIRYLRYAVPFHDVTRDDDPRHFA